jgi:hypothetical protein
MTKKDLGYSLLQVSLHTEPSLNIIPSRAIENFNCVHLHKIKLLLDTATNGAPLK